MILQTKSQLSSNTYIPYFKEANETRLSRDSTGERLLYGDWHIICRNDGFELRDNETEKMVGFVQIRQNSDGIGIVDRVLTLKQFIEKFTAKTQKWNIKASVISRWNPQVILTLTQS